jgi:hypothetical protein
MLFFPFEIETAITAEQGRIWITQTHMDGSESFVELTVHQFMEIYNRQKMIVEAASGKKDEL